MQVTNEFDVVSQKKVGCNFIVGGLSEHKQKRVLKVNRPPILVATPGRLWELVSSTIITTMPFSNPKYTTPMRGIYYGYCIVLLDQ